MDESGLYVPPDSPVVLHLKIFSSSNMDAQTNPSLSNLIIKGIIALSAMSRISDAAGQSSDASRYRDKANEYVKIWEERAKSAGGDHLKSTFGENDSWALIYNLFVDKWLGTNIVQDNVSPSILV